MTTPENKLAETATFSYYKVREMQTAWKRLSIAERLKVKEMFTTNQRVKNDYKEIKRS